VTVTSIATTPTSGPSIDAELHRRLTVLTLPEKVHLLTGETVWTTYAAPAAGLRSIVVSDGPAGVRGTVWDERSTSANVPSPTALAACWDTARVRRLGALLAGECRRKGVDVLLAPTVNLQRSPYGGRHFECFSEDPLLTSAIGVAYVLGLQENGVAATVKHFVANDSETERFTLDARVGESALRELYLAPFEAITTEGGAWAVMAAYNGVNGSTMTESPMLREVLKDEWGYDGLVMSDWTAARSTDAAGNAGLDLAMPGPAGPWGAALLAAVLAGSVSERAIDDKVLRLLRLAARVGALDGVAPVAPPARPWPADEIAGELRQAAAAGTVLLRNLPPVGGDGAPLLPLDPGTLHRVAVIGPNASRLRTLGGGSATVFPPYVISLPEGLRAALGDRVEVTTTTGVRAHTRVSIAEPDLLRYPGRTDSGMDVRFLAADGRLLGSEARHHAAFNWAGRLAGVDPLDVGTIEVHTVLQADGAGRYTVGASGTGWFELLLDGRSAFDHQLALAPGLDPVEGLSRPPQHCVEVALAAGQRLPVVLRHRLRSGAEGLAELGVTFQLNVEPPHRSDTDGIAGAVALAAAADVAIVVVGTTEEVESEGYDRDSLALPGRQDDLVAAVAAANPRTVVVINAGSPVLLPWVEQVPAVLMAWFPGQEGGHALSDVLLGRREPAGRLPVSWPATEGDPASTRPVDGVLEYTEGLFVGYRGYDRDASRPEFCFGHGLGYTEWEYRQVVAAPAQAGRDVELTVTVTNVGPRAGQEVIQVYAEGRPGLDTSNGAAGRIRGLVGFAIAAADPGRDAVARVRVPAAALRHWDERTRAWSVASGPLRLSVGSSSRDPRLRTVVSLD
jgi:beta-glucosidase